MRSTTGSIRGRTRSRTCVLSSRAGRKDLIALTEDELNELADKTLDVHGEFGPTFRAMVVFAAYVGLRPGELFALERGDVGHDEVTIRQNLDGTGTIKAPKNGRERIVVLPPPRTGRARRRSCRASTFLGSS